jgi:transposase
MPQLFWLSDESWSVVEPLLPDNQPGARRVDDRRVISGILHVLRTGSPWRNCPAEYGPSTTIDNRFNRLRGLLAAAPPEIGSMASWPSMVRKKSGEGSGDRHIPG